MEFAGIAFLKALVAIDSDRILGFMNFGVGAGEVLSAVQIAVMGGLPYTALRNAVLAHPTLVEGIHNAIHVGHFCIKSNDTDSATRHEKRGE